MRDVFRRKIQAIWEPTDRECALTVESVLECLQGRFYMTQHPCTPVDVFQTGIIGYTGAARINGVCCCMDQ